MTDAEWKANIKNESNKKLIQDLEFFGCDSYYYGLWRTAIKEVARRLDVDFAALYDKDEEDQ